MWLFALLAHDGFSNMRPEQWGLPLASSLLYLVGFTFYECYQDFREYKAGLKKQEEEEEEEPGRRADGRSLSVLPPDGDGVDEAAVDQAVVSPPGDDAATSTDDVDVEAGREKDGEEADPVQPPTADEQSQFGMTIADVIPCNYTHKEEGGATSGTSANAEAASSVPPPPESGTSEQ